MVSGTDIVLINNIVYFNDDSGFFTGNFSNVEGGLPGVDIGADETGAFLPTPTPIPTIPGPQVVVDLSLSSNLFTPGDSFILTASVTNRTDQVLFDMPFVLLLEIYSDYYWFPVWDEDFQYESLNIGFHPIEITVFDFIWPDVSGHAEPTLMIILPTMSLVCSMPGAVSLQRLISLSRSIQLTSFPVSRWKFICWLRTMRISPFISWITWIRQSVAWITALYTRAPSIMAAIYTL